MHEPARTGQRDHAGGSPAPGRAPAVASPGPAPASPGPAPDPARDAAASPPGLDGATRAARIRPALVVSLQRTAGNAAVHELLAGRGRPARTRSLAAVGRVAVRAAPTGTTLHRSSPHTRLLQRQEAAQEAPGPSDVAPEDRPELSLGSSDPFVEVLQTKLKATRGRTGLAVTGTFDAATRAAVIDFQEQMRLVEDGIVGRRTWTALDAVSGGTALNEADLARLMEAGGRGLALVEAGRFEDALPILMGAYADPVLTAKPELRHNIVFEIGTCHHGSGRFAEAISFYEESAAAPGIGDRNRSDVAERIREARLGLPPTPTDELATRRRQPGPSEAAPATP